MRAEGKMRRFNILGIFEFLFDYFSCLVAGLRAWRHRPRPTTSAVFVAGLCLSYLLMPLVHHFLFAPPAYRYISASSNFFALSVGVQSLAFFMAAMLAFGSTRLRRRLR